jgi:hypothetical protein
MRAQDKTKALVAAITFHTVRIVYNKIKYRWMPGL